MVFTKCGYSGHKWLLMVGGNGGLIGKTYMVVVCAIGGKLVVKSSVVVI